ncbi:hypothetical protein AN931_23385 [Mycobacterium intracellulare subsp. chimaera]|nr:hypothetical protein AN480_29215 [Mycobacterium intracellulare subsp. chimaera]KLO34063.1 membrane protein [Mycobacterium nebraskense]KPN48692.1 hypothetical protein AN931_23385 [Mycobacterium intracellulare subsp. chimaera]OCB27565.1 hypothetical protein A9X02_00705 [Mycobacterium malmoense]
MVNMHIAGFLALSSALCGAVGDVLQQRATHRVTDDSVGPTGLIAKLLCDQRWCWGLLIMLASVGLQAAALGEGSVLLVQPLLMFSLLFALPINARLSHRTVSAGEWLWAGLLTVAVIVIVTVGDPQAGRSSASLHAWAGVAMVLGPLLTGCVAAGRIWGGALAAVLYALVSGSLWGIFAVLTKEVVGRLNEGVWTVVWTPELYALLLVALGGFVGGQLAFRAGPLTASMPTLQVSQPVVAAVVGVAVLGETLDAGPAGLLALAAATLVMVTAIFNLARVDAVATQSEVEEDRRVPLGQPA